MAMRDDYAKEEMEKQEQRERQADVREAVCDVLTVQDEMCGQRR